MLRGCSATHWWWPTCRLGWCSAIQPNMAEFTSKSPTFHLQVCHLLDHEADVSWCLTQPFHKQVRWQEPKTHNKNILEYITVKRRTSNHGSLHVHRQVKEETMCLKMLCQPTFGNQSSDFNKREGSHTMSVPKSMHRMVTVPRGRGMSKMINIRKGLISGMLLVSV